MQQEQLLEYTHIFIPGEDNSPVTLLLLHGTGGGENDLVDIGKNIHPTAHILSPRGNVLEGQYNRFFERLSEGVFNEEDIIKRAKELSDFISAAKDKYNLQQTKLVAVGFSNGANIAAAMLLLHPEVLSGAILLRSMTPLVPAQAPDLTGKPILLLNGALDSMIDPEKAEGLRELFHAHGAAVTQEWLGADHQLTTDDIEISSQWITDNFK